MPLAESSSRGGLAFQPVPCGARPSVGDVCNAGCVWRSKAGGARHNSDPPGSALVRRDASLRVRHAHSTATAQSNAPLLLLAQRSHVAAAGDQDGPGQSIPQRP
eukprot:scaffold2390_cov280-Prasinococcus_capsulatus_cf.AAC.8